MLTARSFQVFSVFIVASIRNCITVILYLIGTQDKACTLGIKYSYLQRKTTSEEIPVPLIRAVKFQLALLSRV